MTLDIEQVQAWLKETRVGGLRPDRANGSR
jgi:hypothetical protein